MAQCTVNGKYTYLGVYTDELEAAQACRDARARKTSVQGGGGGHDRANNTVCEEHGLNASSPSPSAVPAVASAITTGAFPYNP